MRLWHYKLIPYLPKGQLIAQWRELNSIYKKQDNHILINYIYKHESAYLYTYSLMVISEMENRGYKINKWENFNNYFKEIPPIQKTVYYPEHNDQYLVICYYNLLEKFLRGQADYDCEKMENLYCFMKEKELI